MNGSKYTIGRWRETAVFKVNIPTQLGAGKRDGYTTLLTTRGQLRKSSGRRGLEFGEIANKESFEFICRFQSSLEAQISPSMKVDIGNYRYTVDTWERVDQLNHIYIFRLNVERVIREETSFITGSDGAAIIDSDNTFVIYG